MTSTPWTLEPDSVRLKVGLFEAVIDPQHPELGLHSLSYGGEAVPATRLLAFTRPGLEVGELAPLAERFVRGNELVTSYAESAQWPVQVDSRFRALPADFGEGLLAVIEVIVSVRTQQWDSRSELTLESRLNATETLRLVDAPRLGRTSVSPSSSEVLAGSSPRCVLFRLEGEQVSYVEMLAPADSGSDEVLTGGDAAIRHRVFPHTLERGVIVRIRVRGALVARQQDVEAASQLYRNFTDEEPPLGS